MTSKRYDLTDFAWSIICPLLPNKLRGMPRVDDQRVLNGIYGRMATTGYNRLCPLASAGCLGPNFLRRFQGLRQRSDPRAGGSANIRPLAHGRRGPDFTFRNRYRVEHFFNKNRRLRGISTRFEKNDADDLAPAKLAAARIWIRFVSRRQVSEAPGRSFDVRKLA